MRIFFSFYSIEYTNLIKHSFTGLNGKVDKWVSKVFLIDKYSDIFDFDMPHKVHRSVCAVIVIFWIRRVNSKKLHLKSILTHCEHILICRDSSSAPPELQPVLKTVENNKWIKKLSFWFYKHKTWKISGKFFFQLQNTFSQDPEDGREGKVNFLFPKRVNIFL